MRLPAVVAGVLAAMIAFAAPAFAHVTVNSSDAEQGGYAVLTFRVPTESDTASTTALTVQLPENAPFQSVSVQPHPGWTFTTKKSGQTVTEIDWTADSAATAIKPGEFDQFPISVGPLPKLDSITFKAIQTYSDGKQVNWTEVPAPGSTAEPEHPAPTLELAPAVTVADTPAAKPAKSSSQTGPVVLASIALAVAVAALGASLWKRRGAR